MYDVRFSGFLAFLVICGLLLAAALIAGLIFVAGVFLLGAGLLISVAAGAYYGLRRKLSGLGKPDTLDPLEEWETARSDRQLEFIDVEAVVEESEPLGYRAGPEREERVRR